VHYRNLRHFLEILEAQGELKRIGVAVSPRLEMTEICDRTLRRQGPALLFENPQGYDIPVLGNLFGTPRRVALGMGADNVEALREIGELLAFLKEPDPPKGLRDALNSWPMFKQVLNMAPKTVRNAPCQAIVAEGEGVDLSRLPIQTCWPGDAGPLITWALVVTKGPGKERQNLGIYRQQVVGPNRVIMRWLTHRGGALDFRDWQAARPSAIATDLIYVPLVTPFLAAAAQRGLRIVDGLGMLLHQAVPGFERWFGVRPEVDAELRALVVADLAG